MHVLRPNRVVVYTPFRGQSLFANDAVDSSIGYPFAFKAHRPYERIKLIHLERVPKKAGLRGPETFLKVKCVPHRILKYRTMAFSLLVIWPIVMF